MVGNPWRGETDIILDGKNYVLHPTFEALSRIEQELGTGLIALARKLSEGKMTLDEMSVIVARCLVPDVQLPDIKETLMRNGIISALQAIANIFALVLGGFDGENSRGR